MLIVTDHITYLKKLQKKKSIIKSSNVDANFIKTIKTSRKKKLPSRRQSINAYAYLQIFF